MSHCELFNHDVSRWVQEDIPVKHLYSGRALSLTRPGDIIQLSPDLRSQWDAITGHYQRINLPHSRNPVWDLSWTKLAESREGGLSVFMFDDAVNPESPAAAWFRHRDQAWFDCVHHIKSKNNFIALARELGVPVPPTICFENKFRLDPRKILFPCLLKPSLSGNGVGIVLCATSRELEAALVFFPDDVPLQIQEEIPARMFINLQYRIINGRLNRLSSTVQIIEARGYTGSRFPSPFSPWETVEPLARWLVEKGMKDVFGFDLAVMPRKAEPRFLALECNPRFNGSTYPVLTALKLGIDCWSYETFSTTFRNLEEIDLAGIEFDAGSGSGIILLNWGTVLVGRLGILLAGPEEKREEIKFQLRKRLNGSRVS